MIPRGNIDVVARPSHSDHSQEAGLDLAPATLTVNHFGGSFSGHPKGPPSGPPPRLVKN